MSISPSPIKKYKTSMPLRKVITCIIPSVLLSHFYLSSKKSHADYNTQQRQLKTRLYKLKLELGPQFQTADLNDSHSKTRQSVIGHLKRCGVIREGYQQCLQSPNLNFREQGQVTYKTGKAFKARNQMLPDNQRIKEQQYNSQVRFSEFENSPCRSTQRQQLAHSIKQNQLDIDKSKLLNPEETLNQRECLDAKSRETNIQAKAAKQKLSRLARNSAYITLTFLQVFSSDSQDEYHPQGIYMKKVQHSILLVQKSHKMKLIDIETQALKGYTVYVDQQCKTQLAKGALAIKDKNFYCKKITQGESKIKDSMAKSKQISKKETIAKNVGNKKITQKKESSLLAKSFVQKLGLRAADSTNDKILELFKSKQTHRMQDSDSNSKLSFEENSLYIAQTKQSYNCQDHNQESYNYDLLGNTNQRSIKDSKVRTSLKRQSVQQNNELNSSRKTFRVSLKKTARTSQVKQSKNTKPKILQTPSIFKNNFTSLGSYEEAIPPQIQKLLQRKMVSQQQKFKQLQDQFMQESPIERKEQEISNRNSSLRSYAFSTAMNFRNKSKVNVNSNSEVDTLIQFQVNKINGNKTKA